MKKLEVRVPHELDREEMRRRINDGLEKARAEYGATVGPIQSHWEAEVRIRIMLTVMGMQFNGQIENMGKELVVQLDLPGMASLFASKIQSGIQERLGGLVGSQQA